MTHEFGMNVWGNILKEQYEKMKDANLSKEITKQRTIEDMRRRQEVHDRIQGTPVDITSE